MTPNARIVCRYFQRVWWSRCLIPFFSLLLVVWLSVPSLGQVASSRSGGPAADTAIRETSLSHSDPIAPVLISVVIVILAARVAGHFFEQMKQPAVLGELLVGVMLGNLYLAGIDTFDFLKVDYSNHHLIDVQDYQHFAGVTIDHLARIGVILLLFQVGLETSIAEMRQVGLSALLVAVIGVVVPTALGWGCGHVLLPEHTWFVHMFIGATLCATSVGITARALQDLGRSKSTEAQIILGAAFIDDVLGLVVLAFAQGAVGALSLAAAGGTATFGFGDLTWIVLKATGFLVGAIVLGQFVSRQLFKVVGYLQGQGLLIVTALAICFTFAWGADAAGLATIVGAFAAGLVLEKVHYRELASRNGEQELDYLIRPLANLFVPIFFVEMGVHVDLTSFAQISVLGLAAVLIVVAILGKQACALGVLQPGADRLTVGLGMIPRGEVGLIFAATGMQLQIGNKQVIDSNTYSALVVTVIATTLVAPPLLKWSLGRSQVEPTGLN